MRLAGVNAGVNSGRCAGIENMKRGANIWDIREGKVVRLALYWDRDSALAALGIEE